MSLSILIPARNEIYLEKTLRNIQQNAEGEIEVLIALDGWVPEPQIQMNDDRFVFYHYPESIGQRKAINEMAKIAKGDFVMKLDAHCALDKGFDVKLAADCEYDWTVVPTMFNLDINTWTPKRHKRTDYMFMGMNEKGELRSLYYTGNDYHRWHRRPELIDDTMGLMGPCFFMHKDRFWELDGCDEGHGGWGQQGVEVACKAWLSGGALKVNKKTWFAHWFRGDIGFPYHLSGRAVSKARAYSKDLWLNDKWPQAKLPFQWLVAKFNPPTWEKKADTVIVDKPAYYNTFRKNRSWPVWMGHKIIKYPTDLMMYAEIILQNKPDFLVEAGTFKGASALFFAHIFDILGHGHVITVDKRDYDPPKHPRITHIIGTTTGHDTLTKVREMVGNGTVMVSLDSDHRRQHVKRELVRYGKICTKGQYMVVEDTNYGEVNKKCGPDEAVEWFMSVNKDFQDMKHEGRYMLSLNPGGWLKKIA